MVRQWPSATAAGRREAQAALNRLLVEVGDGAHQGNDATVGELLEMVCEAKPTVRQRSDEPPFSVQHR